MDFPADITLRKTRMKFELTFKVVLLFSYQGFAFMRKLLYFTTSTFVCQELFSSFLTSFSKLSYFLLLSSSEEVVLFMSCNFYILSHMFYLVKIFFIYLKIFFPISFKSMCSHVQRILSYHNNIITSSFFYYFFFFTKSARYYIYSIMARELLHS